MGSDRTDVLRAPYGHTVDRFFLNHRHETFDTAALNSMWAPSGQSRSQVPDFTDTAALQQSR
jgi:hypothetical protein